jgi:hypothetical protein
VLLTYDNANQFEMSACSSGTVMVRHTTCDEEVGNMTDSQYTLSVNELYDLIFRHTCPDKE